MAASSLRARWLRSRGIAALVIGAGVFAAILLARELGLLSSWEVGSYDNLLRRVPHTDIETPVTVVYVREEHYARFDHPVHDAAMARVLERLGAAGPRAIGLDIYRDKPEGEGRSALRRVFERYPQLVIVEKLPGGDEPGVAAPDFLSNPLQVGFSDVTPDADGVVRRGLLYTGGPDGSNRQSLSVLLAMNFLWRDGQIAVQPDPDVPGAVQFGPTPVPPLESDFGGYKGVDAGGYQYLLDYRRDADAFPGLDFADVHDGDFDPALVRDRVVLLGTSAPSVKDDFDTPISVLSSRGGRILGVQHHAQAVDQLIRYGRGQSVPTRSLDEAAERVWVLAWCLAAALVALVSASLGRLLVTVVGAGGGLVGAGFLALVEGWWLPVVPAATGGLASLVLVVGYVIQAERAERARAETLFSKFVSKRLMDDLWAKRDVFMDGGRPLPQRARVTVMHSDLFGYTAMAEKEDPSDVMKWLGEYTERMANLVEKHGGLVNDFLGDGLMATFGVPVPRASDAEVARDARNAVECALEMQDALAEMNATWEAQGRPTAALRIGILTGPAAVGVIGGSDRMKYATIGNTVNTAARLETHDKLSFEREGAMCRILVGQATRDCLDERFDARCIGDHPLKGRGAPVTIYRVYAQGQGDAGA